MIALTLALLAQLSGAPEQVAKVATAVVVGRVVATPSEWTVTKYGDLIIETYARVVLERWIKGPYPTSSPTPATIIVTFTGGVDPYSNGKLQLRLPDERIPRVGAHVRLYLVPDPSGNGNWRLVDPLRGLVEDGK